MNRPLVAVPMGDPAGIGPEIVLKALSNPEVSQNARCAVIGDHSVLERALGFPGMPSVAFNRIGRPDQGDYRCGMVNLLDMHCVDIQELRVGEVSGICGKAAFHYIAKSIELAMDKHVDAVCTPPINKESLKAGGIPHIGHTEIFAALTHTHDPLTMFEVRNMRVFFLSRHVSLLEACRMTTKERIIDYVKRCTEALVRLGVTCGTMAIAGLNPHSGEHGLFGSQEVDEVFPAVAALKGIGYDVEGPVSADSVFHLALQGRYNSVLSLYHDQGHIAAKTLDFERTVSVTNGMPILRTSVDHGTAMDIAGKGIASPVSLVEAILVAAKYAPRFSETGKYTVDGA